MIHHLMTREKCLQEINDLQDKFNAIKKQIDDNNKIIKDYKSLLDGDLNMHL